MTTYGPFYPNSLVNVSNGGVPWSIDCGIAESVVSGECVTDLLLATDFNVSLPTNSVVSHVRLAPLPDINQSAWNNAEQYIVGPMGEQEAHAEPPVIAVHADEADGITAANVQDSTFGFKLAIYAAHGGDIKLTALALYVDCE